MMLASTQCAVLMKSQDPVCEKPILLDLCAGTKSVGNCINHDEWQYLALGVHCDMGVPDILRDLREWESSGEYKRHCPPGSVGCIWFR